MAYARKNLRVTDAEGNTILDPTVEVRRMTAGMPLVPLFSDRDGQVAIGNPVSFNDGRVQFHCEGGPYQIKITSASRPGYEDMVQWESIGTLAELDSEQVVFAGSPTIVRVVAIANVDVSSGLSEGDSIDGKVLAENDLVLLTAQSDPAENGVRIVPASGAAQRYWMLSSYDVHCGLYFSVMEGSAKAATLWRCTSVRGGDIDVDPITIEEASFGGGRELLTAPRTYYVRADGNDSNDGLANTSGGAFRTKQKAVDTVAGLDIGIHNVTIQCGPETATNTTVLKSIIGAGLVIIVGNEATPSNCTVTVAGGNCFEALFAQGRYAIRGFKLQTTGSGSGIRNYGTNVTFQNIDFGACATAHIWGESNCYMEATGPYTISGGSARHWFSTLGSLIVVANKTVTLTGTPAFSSAFAIASRNAALLINGNTFSGSATGTRYIASFNAAMDVAGGGASYLPGNASGSLSTGGQYA